MMWTSAQVVEHRRKKTHKIYVLFFEFEYKIRLFKKYQLKSHDQFANIVRIALGREMKKQVSKRCFLTLVAKTSKNAVFSFGSPKGNRTPDSAVRGRRLNRLTMGPFENNDNILSLLFRKCKNYLKIYLKSLSLKTF